MNLVLLSPSLALRQENWYECNLLGGPNVKHLANECTIGAKH